MLEDGHLRLLHPQLYVKVAQLWIEKECTEYMADWVSTALLCGQTGSSVPNMTFPLISVFLMLQTATIRTQNGDTA
jgi:hypothetical protein